MKKQYRFCDTKVFMPKVLIAQDAPTWYTVEQTDELFESFNRLVCNFDFKELLW